MLDRFKDAMLDRFKNAQWYIGEDGVSVTIYDASDLDGTGPDGHGMVCESATPDDARLIASAPGLLSAAKVAVGYMQWHTEVCSEPLTCPEVEAYQQLIAAIAKVEGE